MLKCQDSTDETVHSHPIIALHSVVLCCSVLHQGDHDNSYTASEAQQPDRVSVPGQDPGQSQSQPVRLHDSIPSPPQPAASQPYSLPISIYSRLPGPAKNRHSLRSISFPFLCGFMDSETLPSQLGLQRSRWGSQGLNQEDVSGMLHTGPALCHSSNIPQWGARRGKNSGGRQRKSVQQRDYSLDQFTTLQ